MIKIALKFDRHTTEMQGGMTDDARKREEDIRPQNIKMHESMFSKSSKGTIALTFIIPATNTLICASLQDTFYETTTASLGLDPIAHPLPPNVWPVGGL